MNKTKLPPPQNIELELCVLGAIMLEPRHAYPLAAEHLSKESFYLDGHRRIFELMGLLHGRGIPPDSDMVLDDLRARGELDQVGGAAVVLAMLNSVPSAASIDYHAKKIAEKAHLRALLRASTQTIEEIYRQDLDTDAIYEKAESTILGLSAERSNTSDVAHIAPTAMEEWELMAARIDERKRRLEAGERGSAINLRPGIPTGFADWDRILGHMRQGEMIVIGARPSVGKTALGLNIAHNVAVRRKEPIPTAIFSLEMNRRQLYERLVSMGTKYDKDDKMRGVNTGQIRNGEMTKDERAVMAQSYNELLQAPIYIDDTSSMTISALAAKCRRAKARHGLGLVIVDYLQLLDGSRGVKYNNSNERVTAISRGCKQIAAELDIPVVVLSQLKRLKDQRKDQRPCLSDLRESGAIEQDADVVTFIHRSATPTISYCCKLDITAQGTCSKCGGYQLTEVELLTKKNRNYTTGDCTVRWAQAITRFFDRSRF